MGARGPKRRWTSAAALQRAVDTYFEKCEMEAQYPSVTGLALHLGFACRQALDRYTDRDSDEPEDKIVGIITRAKTRIEEANIQAAYNRDASAGARFILQNGFGYSDKKEVGMNGGTITVQITDDEES